MIAECDTVLLEYLHEKGSLLVIHLMRKNGEGLADRAWEEECQHLSDAIVVLQSIRQGQILGHEDSDFFDIAFSGPMLVQLLVMELIEFRTEVSPESA